MKNSSYVMILIVLAFYGFSISSNAQDETEKKTARIDLSYYQSNDEMPVLKVAVKTKNGRRFEPVEDVLINLFFMEESAEGFIGRVKTNDKGLASLSLSNKYKQQWEGLSAMTFIATLTSDKMYEDASSEIEITKAKIELSLEEEDSIKIIRAKLLALEDSSWIEVPETDIKLVVKRLLSDLSAGDEELYTTDEAGTVEAEFTKSIPGNENGELFIGAKTDDNEVYGNISTTRLIKWGTPTADDQSFARRTLFATRDKTPIWLLIFPNLIIAAVWGSIFYLIYLIAQIKRMGKVSKTE